MRFDEEPTSTTLSATAAAVVTFASPPDEATAYTKPRKNIYYRPAQKFATDPTHPTLTGSATGKRLAAGATFGTKEDFKAAIVAVNPSVSYMLRVKDNQMRAYCNKQVTPSRDQELRALRVGPGELHCPFQVIAVRPRARGTFTVTSSRLGHACIAPAPRSTVRLTAARTEDVRDVISESVIANNRVSLQELRQHFDPQAQPASSMLRRAKGLANGTAAQPHHCSLCGDAKHSIRTCPER